MLLIGGIVPVGYEFIDYLVRCMIFLLMLKATFELIMLILRQFLKPL